MDKIYRILAIVVMIAFFNSEGVAAAAEPNQKVAIGVLDFQSHNQNNAYGQMVTEFMITDISRIKSCAIVERNELKKVFAEQYLSEQGLVENISTGKYQGKGINYILLGSVSTTLTKEYDQKNKKYNYKNTATVTAKLIDLNEQKGQIVWTGQRTVENYDENRNLTIEEAAYDVARQLYEFFPIKGYVVKMTDGKYYIDLGSQHGVSANDILKVEGVSDSMIHPITGKTITIKSTIGKLKVKEVYEDFCVAELKDKDKPLKIYTGDQVVREIRDKPNLFLGIGWSGKHVF